MKRRTLASFLIGAGATAAALWLYVSQGRPARRGPAQPVVIQDGKTIDFSSGTPVVRDSPADRASMDAAVREIDAVSKSVTFPPNPPQKK